MLLSDGIHVRWPMNDFTFLVGSFDVVNRRLKKALAGCTEWEEFPATAKGISLLGGAAHLDELSMPTKGYSGVTLRLFNPEREEWSLYWISGSSPTPRTATDITSKSIVSRVSRPSSSTTTADVGNCTEPAISNR